MKKFYHTGCKGNIMPKSKNNRKGKKRNDTRPTPRSGKNEGQASYQTGRPMGADNPSGTTPIAGAGEPRQCPYLDRVATLENAFTPDECQQIITTALNDWKEQESMIQRDEGGKIEQNFVDDYDYRNTTLFIPEKPDEWLFSKIIGHIMNFNNSEQGYNFDVRGLAEPPNMMRYEAANINKNGKPGKYDWHLDIGPGPVPSMRKISYSLQLNSGEYEGGALAFNIGSDTTPIAGQNSSDNIGTVYLFPSYMCHRVTEVTSGTRYALVGWCHGSSFS